MIIDIQSNTGVQEIKKLPLCDMEHKEQSVDLDVLGEPRDSPKDVCEDVIFDVSYEERSSETLKLVIHCFITMIV